MPHICFLHRSASIVLCLFDICAQESQPCSAAIGLDILLLWHVAKAHRIDVSSWYFLSRVTTFEYFLFLFFLFHNSSYMQRHLQSVRGLTTNYSRRALNSSSSLFRATAMKHLSLLVELDHVLMILLFQFVRRHVM